MNEPVRIAPDVLERCHESFIDASWELTRNIPGAKIKKWLEGTAIKSDLPTPVVNVLFAFNSLVNPKEVLDRARSFFGKQSPWRVVTNDNSKDTFQPIVESKEFRMVPGNGSPGMVLSIPQDIPANPNSIQIKRVSDSKELKDFYSVAGRSFGIPVFLMRTSFPRVPESTPQASTIFFVGYSGKENKPVATSTLVASRNVAGIFSVGTLKNFRNKGFGVAMTWAAIEAGRDLGCDTSYLAATEMGFPVYEKMGFRKAADYPEWNNPISSIAKIKSIFSIISYAFR